MKPTHLHVCQQLQAIRWTLAPNRQAAEGPHVRGQAPLCQDGEQCLQPTIQSQQQLGAVTR